MDMQKFWTRLERKYGRRFPPDLRAQFEADSWGHSESVMAEDIEADVAAFARHLAIYEYLPEPIPEQSRNRTKRYVAPFKQRLHLVDFVLSRHVTTGEVLSRRVNVRHRRRRINWGEMYEEWNREHPAREAKSSPASLKAAYYSAIKEQAVQDAFFAEFNERWDGKLREMVTEFLEANPQLAEGLARADALMRQVDERLQRADEALQRALEPVRQIDERLQQVGEAFQRLAVEPLSQAGRSLEQWYIAHKEQAEVLTKAASVMETQEFRERWGERSLNSMTESDWQAMEAEIESLIAVREQPLGPSGGEQQCGGA